MIQKVFLSLFISASLCRGAFEPMPAGGRSLAMASSLCALDQELQTLLLNPAIRLEKGIQAAFSHAQLLNCPDLACVQALIVVSGRAGRVALHTSRFGPELYQETVIGLTGSFDWKIATLGLRGKLCRLFIRSYGELESPAWDCGITLHWRRFHAGLAAGNLKIPHARASSLLKTLIRLGIGIRTGSMTFGLALQQEENAAFEWNGGLEWQKRGLALRFGAGSGGLFSAGFGVESGRFRLDYGFACLIPGTTHQVTCLLTLADP